MKTFVPILLTVLAVATPGLAQQTMDHSAHGEMAQMDHSNHGNMDMSGAQPDDTPATTAYRDPPGGDSLTVCHTRMFTQPTPPSSPG